MKLPFVITALWALLWLAGSWLVARNVEADLRMQVGQALSQAGVKAAKVTPEITGRSITLTGVVTSAETANHLEAMLRDRVRLSQAWASGKGLDPISKIDRSALVTDLRPRGWGLLLASAQQATLFGLAANEAEGLRMESSLRPLLSGVNLKSTLHIEPEVVTESETPTADLPSATGFSPALLRQGMAAFANWGDHWTLLDLSLPLERLRQQLLPAGVEPRVWEETLGPALQRLQDQRAITAAAEAEERRLAAQAVGHVVLAVRADTVLIKGELGSSPGVTLVTESIERHAAGRRVIHELLHDPYRRTESDFRRLTGELPALPTGNTARQVAIGTAVSGWKILPLSEIDPEDANSVMTHMLPANLDRRLALGDIMEAIVWSETAKSRPGDKMLPSQPAYLLMAFAGQRLLVRGRVPDEPMRSQITSALKGRYALFEMDIQVRLEPNCEATGPFLQTLAMLPPAPGLDTSGQLALAVMGKDWSLKPARASLLEAGTLEQSGFLPAGLTINEVLPDVLDISPTLKQHFRLHEATAPPGIPTQTIGPK